MLCLFRKNVLIDFLVIAGALRQCDAKSENLNHVVQLVFLLSSYAFNPIFELQILM